MGITSLKGIEKMNHVAFFDLDRTLIRAISGRELAREAVKQGLISFPVLLRAASLFLGYKLSVKDPLVVIENMIGWLKGIPAETIKSLCSRVSRDVLIPSVFPAARHEIEKHKMERASTVILSSALSCICSELADYLRIDDVICSELEIVNGYCTGLVKGSPCFGEEKLERLRNYCEKNNNKINESWYYGDSIYDLPVMSYVGHPVCINPDRKLRKTAVINKWNIHYWR